MNASLQVNHYQVLDTELFKYKFDSVLFEATTVLAGKGTKPAQMATRRAHLLPVSG